MRPPPPSRSSRLPAHDSGPYGLAAALEPEDDDDDVETYVGPMSVRPSLGAARASMRPSLRAVPASVRPSPRPSAPHSIRSPNGTLAPVSVRTAHAPIAPAVQPMQVQDFAFADTVFAKELEDEAPSSGPIIVSDPVGSQLGPQCVTPLAFPMPDVQEMAQAADADLAARVRHSVRGTLSEMRDAWEATAITTVDASEPPPSPASFFVRRVVAMCASWQWDRADVLRAAVIGVSVFVVAAALGAVAVATPAAATSTDGEVRGIHTLEQHTGRTNVVHLKATR